MDTAVPEFGYNTFSSNENEANQQKLIKLRIAVKYLNYENNFCLLSLKFDPSLQIN